MALLRAGTGMHRAPLLARAVFATPSRFFAADTAVTHPEGLTHRISTYFMPQVRCVQMSVAAAQTSQRQDHKKGEAERQSGKGAGTRMRTESGRGEGEGSSTIATCTQLTC